MSLTIQGNGGLGPDRLYDYSWQGLVASGDQGTPATIPAHVRELSYQVTGTFGAGTFNLEGSNDGTNYAILKDVGGTAIAATDTTIWRFANPPKYIKPVATAGSAGNVNAYIHGAAVG
jgi:hypothetical protein